MANLVSKRQEVYSLHLKWKKCRERVYTSLQTYLKDQHQEEL